MKKRTKVTIAVIALAILLTSITFNVILGLKAGIIKEASFLSGSVDESWRKNDANILYDHFDYGRFYSNYDGDYITKVYLSLDDNGMRFISYDTDFNTFNDLEVYFVLVNQDGYKTVTPVTRTDIPLGGDYVEFYYANKTDELRITEIWVRTID